MSYWVPVWVGMIDSSIWEEDPLVMKVFLGMLMLKDQAQTVITDTYKLARRLHMDYGVVSSAIGVLTSPDKRREGQEHEGRRLLPIEGGWFVLNGEKYQDKMKIEAKRRRDRQAQANRRARLSGKPEPYPKKQWKRPRSPTPAEAAKLEEAHAAVKESVQGLNKLQHALEGPIQSNGVSYE